jgi:pilus assembly protein CpaB
MARIQQLTLAKNNRAMLLLALVAGLVAAGVVFVVLNKGSSDSGTSSSAAGPAAVLVAATDIAAGTAITSDMLEVQHVPDSLVVRGVFTDTQPVVGQASRVSIAKGEQITPAKIGVPVPDKGLSGVVPAGKRAVALDVSQVTAVGGLLLPGDHVDIVAVSMIDNAPNLASNESLLRTETILQNVEVLSVAQEAQTASAQASTQSGQGSSSSYTSGQIPDNVKEQPSASTLTMALDPQQAQVLIRYQQHAEKVWAVLRPYGDQSIQDVPPDDVIVTRH